MRTPPLFRFGRRAKSTSWGIALCTMFIVASFSVAGGLSNSMDALEKNFEADYYLVTKPGSSGLEFFADSAISVALGGSAFGVFTSATMSPSGPVVNVFALQEGALTLPGIPYLEGSQMLAGVDALASGSVTLRGVGTVSAIITGTFESPLFPSSWVLGSMPLLEDLAGSNGLFNFAIEREVTQSSEESLTSDGFVVQPMVGIIDFLDSGVGEIERDITWALLPSAFVIAILAYSFIGTETADRRHEIGVVKTIGAGRWMILGYLLSNALVICAWGGLLGLALGIILSYGISTVASSIFSSVLLVKAGELFLVEAYLATVASGLVGALIPSVRMTMSSPVEDLKEVMPSS